ncbi:UDP-2,3-diacylglucosamine diphosphatase [Paludibacterium paludis]|uniref:UDP-2,3-diacylglucosamine hydrolase n=1 Tax=Paludibacterium paludis TaxID=1225769 RepID=A0A918NYU8_9NEIS|nr:UDP-2,3-diacylglucosamine diphosphatase [Paludibacterium paludis]GGY06181.1 UDP-2,3-diacylglucosamine hydrolase [Paludibacterium paludis]
MPIHFISDLHLSDGTPDLDRLFVDTLDAWQGRIDALYILGDLFEYWIGDDDDTPALEPLLAAMKDFSRRTPLHVMHGNRDFLMGKGFEARSGARIITDPALIGQAGARFLLTHGDALCTADTAYQAFRAQSRSPAWQAAMLARPLAERRAMAEHARRMSEANKAAVGMSEISDVTADAVEALLDSHGWPTLIHGHTHRPATHRHAKDGRTAERWVIRDWHDGKGGFLKLDGGELSAHPLG